METKFTFLITHHLLLVACHWSLFTVLGLVKGIADRGRFTRCQQQSGKRWQFLISDKIAASLRLSV